MQREELGTGETAVAQTDGIPANESFSSKFLQDSVQRMAVTSKEEDVSLGGRCGQRPPPRPTVPAHDHGDPLKHP